MWRKEDIFRMEDQEDAMDDRGNKFLMAELEELCRQGK